MAAPTKPTPPPTSNKNVAPDAVSDTFTTPYDTNLIITAKSLLANDTDANKADLLSIISVAQPANGTLTWNADRSAQTFDPAADFSGPTSFTYTIADGRGGTDTATVNITVGAPPLPTPLPTLVVSDTSIVEGAEAIFLVSLSAAATTPVSVNYVTANGTATLFDGDYTARFGTLTFPAGVTQLTVAVPTAADRGIEPDETFTLNLSAPHRRYTCHGDRHGDDPQRRLS